MLVMKVHNMLKAYSSWQA